MANKRRGEVEFEALDKAGNLRIYKMRMSLGAMAELEDVFELEDISKLSTIFEGQKFKIRQLIQLLGALIRGGGEDVDDSDIESMDLDAVEAFSKAMEAINMQGENKDKSPKHKAATRAKKK